MKNLTEFSGVILRRGAKVRADKLAELKAAAKSVAPAEATTEVAPEANALAPDAEAPAEAVAVAADAPAAKASTDAPDAEAQAEGVAADAAVAADAPAAEASTDAPAAEAQAEGVAADAAVSADAPAAEASTADEAPATPQIDEEALAAAVAEEMGFSADRARYLLGALKAVGRKGVEQVRNVRVFQGEEGPRGGFTLGDLHFVVDRIVVGAKPGAKDDGKGRGGKGRGGKGKSGGPGGKPSGFGGGGGGGGRGGSGFDVMARDEKPGDVPSGGLGWSLSRKPGSEPKEGRKPGRKGPPRRGKPGDKPGNDRTRNRNRKSGPGGRKPPMPEVTVKAPLQTAPKAPAPTAPEPKPAPAPAADVTPTESK